MLYPYTPPTNEDGLITKVCNKCNTEQPITGFTRARSMKGGYLNQCKRCRCAARNRLKKNAQKRIWQSANKEKHNAHSKVRTALKRGKIQRQGCVVCGDIKTQAHHEDYSKPLDVVWLCPAHHSSRHKELRLRATAVNGPGVTQ